MNWGFFVSSNTSFTESSRTQLSQEIEQTLINMKDLRPFISAWSVIDARFCGIAELEEELDPVFQIHSLIKRERTSTGLITEELFVAWMLQLSFLKKNIVCVKSGNVWEPTTETYSDFRSRSDELVVSSSLNNSEKVNVFYKWVVQLCNWDGSILTNQSKQLH